MAFEAKRQHKRTQTRDGVRLMTRSGVEYATYEDMSVGGLRLHAERTMLLGDVIHVDFAVQTPQGRKTLKVLGRVTRSQKSSAGFDIGIEFVDLPNQFRILLEAAVDSEAGPF